MLKKISGAPCFLFSRSLFVTLAIICAACSEQPVANKPSSVSSPLQTESYVQKLVTRIKSNTTFIVPKDLIENDPVEYEVQLYPDGTIRHINKIKSSNVPGFDDAVLQAVTRAQPFPRDNSGNVPPSFIFLHRPLAGKNSLNSEKRKDGVFQLRSVTVTKGTFVFTKWDKYLQNNSSQLIEVYKDNEPDIQTAMIKKMVGIIREDKHEDFRWDSYRLGKLVTLSARPEDDAALSHFLMLEFFPNYVPIK